MKAITAIFLLLLLSVAVGPAVSAPVAPTAPGAWLQPGPGHSPAALAKAYKDGRLDHHDPIYYVGNRVVEAWRQAPLRPGSAGSRHGYRVGFVNMELVVLEANEYTASVARGRLPSEYLRLLLPEILKAVRGESSQVVLSACPSAHLRFSEAGWLPPGSYPLRDARGQERGAAALIVERGHPQAVVPLFGGAVALVVPEEPLLYQRQPGANPAVSWAVLDGGGRELPLQFLPAGNHTNRVISTPENPELGRENALRVAARLGANLWIAVVPPRACRGG
jgi:hypothetical protein